MKATIPIFLNDPTVADRKGVPPLEDFVVEEPFFLDGPVSRRVAMLDFDPGDGRLSAAAPFVLASDGAKGSYTIANRSQLDSPDLLKVACFGMVLRTIAMYEEDDALGRPVRWAFDGPQLLVVPRAGDWANAYYERESRSLQFFSFKPEGSEQLVHTCQSHDVVAHETAHAILDGIAPALYHAITPQALAIHEAVADLTAALSAFRSRTLARAVLEQTKGSIADSSAFSAMAEAFGSGIDEGQPSLRDLRNEKSFDSGAAEGSRVTSDEPHELSEVLSGALYTVLIRMHEALWREYSGEGAASPELVSGAESARQEARSPAAASSLGAAHKALAVASDRFKRTLIRGLDYLPPGDVSFVDLARAILAADQASHPDSDAQRSWIREEFARRAMVPTAQHLDVETDVEEPALKKLDLDALVDSDWVAYEFARKNRALLRIPDKIPFEVHPRLDVTKLLFRESGQVRARECLFKVSWTDVEPNDIGVDFPSRRRVVVGTTLAIDWDTKRRKALVSSARNPASELDAEDLARDRKSRDRFLRGLVDREVLQVGRAALGADGRPLHGAVRGDVLDGVLRVRGSARTLHVSA